MPGHYVNHIHIAVEFALQGCRKANKIPLGVGIRHFPPISRKQKNWQKPHMGSRSKGSDKKQQQRLILILEGLW